MASLLTILNIYMTCSTNPAICYKKLTTSQDMSKTGGQCEDFRMNCILLP